jgi:hypothetical protein
MTNKGNHSIENMLRKIEVVGDNGAFLRIGKVTGAYPSLLSSTLKEKSTLQ